MKILFITLFIFCSYSFSNNVEKININFKDLKIEEFIKITSKYLNKNILYTNSIEGDVNFVANKDINKSELLNILSFVLDEKGYSTIENEEFIKIVNKSTILENKEIEIIKINNIDVVNLEKLLNKILNEKDFFDNSLKPIITIEKESNSIIIAGVEKDLFLLKDLIKQIDINKPQIYIKAKIIEISETKTKNIGMEYGLKGFNKYSSSTLSSFSSSLNSMTNTTIDFSEFSTFGFDISSLSKALTLGATINFLKQNEAVDVISEPSILCVNNIESSIYVGETKSFKTGQTTNETGTSESFKREDIGLKLKVKPRISQNRVTLEINTILEDAKESINSQNLDTSKKEIITTAILNNGESVIIGGLIKNKKSQIESKVPLFGDIPILGTLFKNEKYLNDKINLLIVITPYIIPKDSSLTTIKAKVDNLDSLENIYTNSITKVLKKSDRDSEKEERKKRHEEIMKEYFNQ